MLKRNITLIVGSSLLLAGAGQSCRKVEEPSLSGQSAADATASGISDYAIYTMQCQLGSKFLQVAGDTLYNQKYADGAPLQQASASMSYKNISGWQKWHLVYQSSSPGGARYYQVRNVFSGKLLTSPSNTAGAQLVQQGEAATLSDQQLWEVRKVDSTGTSRYRLLNKGNGLAVTNHNGSTSDNTAITQEKLQASWWRQRWALALQADQTYRDDQVVRFFQRDSRSQGSVAFDGGTSIPLKDGRVLWTTCDAYDGVSLDANNQLKVQSGYYMYRNSVLIQPSVTNWDNTATPNMTGPNSTGSTGTGIKPVFPLYPDVYGGNALSFPGAGIEIGNHVYVNVAEGSDAYGYTGPHRHVLYDLPEVAGTNWTPVRTLPAGLSDLTTTIGYDIGMVQAANDTVYAFGSHPNGYSCDDIYVARFPAANPQDWAFWNGPAAKWTKTPPNYVNGSPAPAGKIAGFNHNTSITFLNGKYVAVSADLGLSCNQPFKITVATASSPTGPFKKENTVYNVTEYMNGGSTNIYAVHVHPEAVNGRSELLVTYCVKASACNISDKTNGVVDPNTYRLKGIRIPYSLLP